MSWLQTDVYRLWCCVLLLDTEVAACDPKCRYEVRQWKHGAYTLVHDTDLTACEFALDAIFFCCCKGLCSAVHTLLALQPVVVLHQGAPGQMTWLEDPPPCVLLCFGNSVNRK